MGGMRWLASWAFSCACLPSLRAWAGIQGGHNSKERAAARRAEVPSMCLSARIRPLNSLQKWIIRRLDEVATSYAAAGSCDPYIGRREPLMIFLGLCARRCRQSNCRRRYRGISHDRPRPSTGQTDTSSALGFGFGQLSRDCQLDPSASASSLAACVRRPCPHPH